MVRPESRLKFAISDKTGLCDTQDKFEANAASAGSPPFQKNDLPKYHMVDNETHRKKNGTHAFSWPLVVTALEAFGGSLRYGIWDLYAVGAQWFHHL